MLLLLLACRDEGLSFHNTDPNVAIVSPPEGAILSSNVVITARIEDIETAIKDLQLIWQDEEGNLLQGTETRVDDEVTLDTYLSPGPHTLNLTVLDVLSAEGSDQVNITVAENHPPTAEFISPMGDFPANTPILVEATVADPDLSDLSVLKLTWQGSPSLSEAPAHPDSSGYIGFYLNNLEIGPQTLQLGVQDPDQATGTALTSFNIYTPDQDLDGHTDQQAGGDDCDDSRADIYPGATEVCDGLDQNCNGQIDEGLENPWYADTDGDGFGDPNHVISQCAEPLGFITDHSDCDDTRSDTYPAAPETCDATDQNCDGQIDEGLSVWWFADTDGDSFGNLNNASYQCAAPPGFIADNTDCDDRQNTIYPGAPEICDGLDQNCDGQIDDGLDLPWYADTDGDGFGDPNHIVYQCAASAGLVADNSDCNDTEVTIHPNGIEICDPNNTDENCDGLADDSTAADSGKTRWYIDNDADTYGDNQDPGQLFCDPPTGNYSADADDCDDSTSSIAPGQDEHCDGIDENCDGQIDNNAIDPQTFYLDADGDSYGDINQTINACTMPNGYVTDANDCDDSDPNLNQGCDGVFSAALADAILLGENADDNAGSASTGIGDFNGDGLADIAVGAFGNDTGGSSAGAGYIVYGPISGTHSLSTADVKLTGEHANDTAGYDMESLNDIDNDGYSELLITAIYTQTNVGSVYLLDGPYINDSLSHADLIVDGNGASSILGIDVGPAGDTDGDGLQEFWVASPYRNNYFGEVSLIELPLSGRTTTAGRTTISGVARNDYAGWGSAGGKDVDGDGLDDLMLSYRSTQNNSNSKGYVALFYGPITTTTISSADTTFEGQSSGDYSGFAVAIGDGDGDGQEDVWIGARYSDLGGSDSGAVYYKRGPFAAGLVSLAGADARLYGETPGDLAGFTITSGDFNGDNIDDLLTGALDVDVNGTRSGGAYMVRGPMMGTQSLSTANIILYGESTYDLFGGTYMGSPGDMDGDGDDEMLIPAYLSNRAGSHAGALYLFEGG